MAVVEGGGRVFEPYELLLWAIAAAGAAVLAAALAIAIILATGSSSAKPAVTQRPAQLAGHTNTTCAPDDTRPIGPGDQGVPACLTR
jgi:hypothetical protein